MLIVENEMFQTYLPKSTLNNNIPEVFFSAIKPAVVSKSVGKKIGYLVALYRNDNMNPTIPSLQKDLANYLATTDLKRFGKIYGKFLAKIKTGYLRGSYYSEIKKLTKNLKT